MQKIRLGTRSSALAKWQAEWVAHELSLHGVEVEFVYIKTQGDAQSGSLATLGGRGLFTKEIQRALLDDRIDLAVHSLKDLPTEAVPGLVIAAVPERETTCDALLGRTASSLSDLAESARVGTGSNRRRAQLLSVRPDLEVLDIRGNVDTRIRKLDDGEYDAILLAHAGLKRLGLDDRISEVLPQSTMVPAVGQGALGLETRANDDAIRELLRPLDHRESHQAVLAERSLLSAMRAGCLAPLGAWARPNGQGLAIDAVVLSLCGNERIEASAQGDWDEAVAVGRAAADALIADGARKLIEDARND